MGILLPLVLLIQVTRPHLPYKAADFCSFQNWLQASTTRFLYARHHIRWYEQALKLLDDMALKHPYMVIPWAQDGCKLL